MYGQPVARSFCACRWLYGQARSNHDAVIANSSALRRYESAMTKETLNPRGVGETSVDAYLLDARVAARQIFNCSERNFYELRKRPGFPPPVILGPRIVRYRRTDLEAFISKLVADAAPQEPAQLIAGKAKRAAKHAQEAEHASAR